MSSDFCTHCPVSNDFCAISTKKLVECQKGRSWGTGKIPNPHPSVIRRGRENLNLTKLLKLCKAFVTDYRLLKTSQKYLKF